MEEKRSFGVLVVDGCALLRSKIDLRGIPFDDTDVWFLDSTFREVAVPADERSDVRGLKVRRVEVVDTVLPTSTGVE
jgi:hypothetical protein